MNMSVDGAFIYFEIPIFGGIPITQTTIWDAMAYFFAQCMKTITAVAFLWTSRTKPLALKMDEYNANVEVEVFLKNTKREQYLQYTVIDAEGLCLTLSSALASRIIVIKQIT